MTPTAAGTAMRRAFSRNSTNAVSAPPRGKRACALNSSTWIAQPGITLKIPNIIYPIGSGPAYEIDTRNVFFLPYNYLRAAPQDPKAGSSNFLGAPSGLMYEDWNFEGNYIVSRDTGPILFRFTADITKVSDMDDMFCGGLALTIALAIAPSLTQSDAKMGELASEYKLRMGEARTVNAIEEGAIEPPEDDWIACRL